MWLRRLLLDLLREQSLRLGAIDERVIRRLYREQPALAALVCVTLTNVQSDSGTSSCTTC